MLQIHPLAGLTHKTTFLPEALIQPAQKGMSESTKPAQVPLSHGTKSKAVLIG